MLAECDVTQNAAGAAVRWQSFWNPRIYVENAIGELKSSTNRWVRHDDSSDQLATVYETRLISGTFFEFMELNKFPFDSQVGSNDQLRGFFRVFCFDAVGWVI